MPNFFKILLGLLSALAVIFCVPMLVEMGDRGLALGLSILGLGFIAVGVRERTRDPDGRAGTFPMGVGTLCLFFLIAVLAV